MINYKVNTSDGSIYYVRTRPITKAVFDFILDNLDKLTEERKELVKVFDELWKECVIGWVKDPIEGTAIEDIKMENQASGKLDNAVFMTVCWQIIENSKAKAEIHEIQRKN